MRAFQANSARERDLRLIFTKVVIVVFDSVGIGAMPDAGLYGDEGSDTLGNILLRRRLRIPELARLGLANIRDFSGLDAVSAPQGAYGKMAEKSKGKDTTTGHWELMGIVLDKAFPIFPHGFPDWLIQEFENRIGRKILGNRAASGTEIIQALGSEHVDTGYPIVYTSADSVFQLAAHEDVIPIDELYRYCRIARELLSGDVGVARVIARPFIGERGGFKRTNRRKDFSLPPPSPTVLDRLLEAGLPSIGIGKIEDIFGGKGLSEAVHTASNEEGLERTVEFSRSIQKGIVFTNLVDFDMLHGHRNDPEGYAGALERADGWIPRLREALAADGLLILTADHGCDPTFPGTDHTREYVFLLCAGENVKAGVNLGLRETFADVGATLSENFSLVQPEHGKSFLKEIAK